MSDTLSPPFLPAFGSGTPGGSVPKTTTYFDTNTTPFTPYIYEAGSWHSFGASGGGANATEIQGRNVSAATPNSGDVLAWNNATNEWEPTASGGSLPSIVQVATQAGTNAPVVMGAAPTQNNLLICIMNGTASSSPGTGWNVPVFTSGGGLHIGFLWKIAGASESATQTPTTDTTLGALSIFEINNGVAGANWFTNSVGSGTAVNQVETCSSGKMVIGAIVDSVAIGPSSITGVTDNGGRVTGGATRGIQAFHLTAPAKGVNTITIHYATSTAFACIMIEIG